MIPGGSLVCFRRRKRASEPGLRPGVFPLYNHPSDLLYTSYTFLCHQTSDSSTYTHACHMFLVSRPIPVAGSIFFPMPLVSTTFEYVQLLPLSSTNVVMKQLCLELSVLVISTISSAPSTGPLVLWYIHDCWDISTVRGRS